MSLSGLEGDITAVLMEEVLSGLETLLLYRVQGRGGVGWGDRAGSSSFLRIRFVGIVETVESIDKSAELSNLAGRGGSFLSFILALGGSGKRLSRI